MARTIVRRLLHAPTRRLRSPEGQAGAGVALELFGLAYTPVEEPAGALAELGHLG